MSVMTAAQRPPAIASKLADRRFVMLLAAGGLAAIVLDPTDPCIFQLSGGTTGIPKLIPRTHNDYAYSFITLDRTAP